MARASGGLPRRVTISDVAAHAGVSKGSISKAINGQPGISESTRRHILEVADRLGWAPSARAMALASGTKTIAVLLNRKPNLLSVDPYWAELISGIESVLSARGYWLLLHIDSYPDAASEVRAYRDLARSDRVDGLLLGETRVDDYRFPVIEEIGVPTVIISKPRSDVGIPWEGPEQPGAGMDEAVRHLFDGGRRNIAYVGGPANLSYTAFRTEVLMRTLGELDIALVGIRATDASPEQSFAATCELLDQARRPDAIIFDSDQMALAGTRAIFARGLTIPGDVAVIGHDGLYAGQWLTPALTTVSQDVEGLGARCATRLLQLLGEPVEQLPPFENPRLVVRESSG